jgi:hypothetical protein
VTGSGTSTITVNPADDLAYTTEYYVLIDATAFDDASSNSYAGISDTTALSFTMATTPGAPTGLAASVPTDFSGGAHGVSTSEYPGEMDLSWTAPTSTGGAAVSDYLIEYSADGSSWTTFADGGSTATCDTILGPGCTASVTGLDDATAYTFRVSAINAAGTSDSSSTAAGTTATIPGLVVVSDVGSQNPGQMDVCFWYPDWPNYNDGGTVVTHYLVEYSTDSTNWTVGDSAVTPGFYTNTCKRFDGLTSGATYMFRATAVNGVGNGPTDTSAQVDGVNSREVCCG